jgi:hypothetical protein
MPVGGRSSETQFHSTDKMIVIRSRRGYSLPRVFLAIHQYPVEVVLQNEVLTLAQFILNVTDHNDQCHRQRCIKSTSKV